jgi:hypothetical protein
MKGQAVLMSSVRDDWETPDDLFQRYRREFDLHVIPPHAWRTANCRSTSGRTT